MYGGVLTTPKPQLFRARMKARDDAGNHGEAFGQPQYYLLWNDGKAYSLGPSLSSPHIPLDWLEGAT